MLVVVMMSVIRQIVVTMIAVRLSVVEMYCPETLARMRKLNMHISVKCNLVNSNTWHCLS
jgi:hypothetical protein